MTRRSSRRRRADVTSPVGSPEQRPASASVEAPREQSFRIMWWPASWRLADELPAFLHDAALDVTKVVSIEVGDTQWVLQESCLGACTSAVYATWNQMIPANEIHIRFSTGQAVAVEVVAPHDEPNWDFAPIFHTTRPESREDR